MTTRTVQRAPHRFDIDVIDASSLDAGLLTVRTRMWNVLYAVNGLKPMPPFGDVRTVAVAELSS